MDITFNLEKIQIYGWEDKYQPLYKQLNNLLPITKEQHDALIAVFPLFIPVYNPSYPDYINKRADLYSYFKNKSMKEVIDLGSIENIDAKKYYNAYLLLSEETDINLYIEYITKFRKYITNNKLKEFIEILHEDPKRRVLEYVIRGIMNS